MKPPTVHSFSIEKKTITQQGLQNLEIYDTLEFRRSILYTYKLVMRAIASLWFPEM